MRRPVHPHHLPLPRPALRRFAERALAASVVAGGLVIAPTAASAQTDPAPEPLVDTPAEPEAPIPTTPIPTPDANVDASTPVVRTGRAGDPAARLTVGTERPDTDTDRDPDAEPLPSTPAPSTSVPEPTPAPAPVPVPSAAPGAAPTPDSAVAIPPSAPRSAPAPTRPEHVVTAGDNLWTIAAAHLARTTGRDVTALRAAELDAYWRRVCDANRPRLRSGDVNLIFADEVIDLPAI